MTWSSVSNVCPLESLFILFFFFFNPKCRVQIEKHACFYYISVLTGTFKESIVKKKKKKYCRPIE